MTAAASQEAKGGELSGSKKCTSRIRLEQGEPFTPVHAVPPACYTTYYRYLPKFDSNFGKQAVGDMTLKAVDSPGYTWGRGGGCRNVASCTRYSGVRGGVQTGQLQDGPVGVRRQQAWGRTGSGPDL